MYQNKKNKKYILLVTAPNKEREIPGIMFYQKLGEGKHKQKKRTRKERK
jgi:hypothetical protein